jgi:hypothetical protein
MYDIYLAAPSYEALVADLAPLGLVMDGMAADAGDGYAAIVIRSGPGIVLLVRCLDAALVVALRRTEMPGGTRIVDRPEDAPVVAGDSGQDLEALKTAACAAVDAEAERRRLLVLTPGEGQALEYQHTAEEAARAVAAPDPLPPGAYPFLAAEAQALARAGVVLDLRQVVDLVVYQRAAWLAYGAAVKAVRRGVKLALDEAVSSLDVAEIVAGIVWPELAEDL